MDLKELLARDEMKQYHLTENEKFIGYWGGDKTVSIIKQSVVNIEERSEVLEIVTKGASVSFWKERDIISTVIF